MLAEAVASCATLAANRKVTVVNRGAASLPPVPMDQKRLVQVFQNLVRNAIEHAPAHTVVSVEVAMEESAGGAPSCSASSTSTGGRSRPRTAPKAERS